MAIADTADALELRREPALGPSALLAAAMHVVLIVLMFVGVKWQSYDPDTVTVELWEPQTEPQAVEPPKPAPPPPPPPKVEVKPEPKVEKPDITLRDKAKPKPKPKPEAKPKPDLEFERQIREQAATEQRLIQEQQKILDDQRRAAEAARKERELQALLARQAADAKAKAQSEWVRKIQAKIRPNVYLPPDLRGNPEAVYLVTLLPDGSVINVRKRRSSGHPGFDTAVERAIEKSSPLPTPEDRSVFTRELELKFRPLDE